MKLILGDLEPRHSIELIKKLPLGSSLSISNLQKVKKFSTPDDVVIFYNYRYRKEYSQIKCKAIYPNLEASSFCANRILQCKILDMFPGSIKREYLEDHCGLIIFEDGYVYKFGNAQQGNDKYLGGKDKGFLTYNDQIIKEEYIKGRSFRLLVITNDMFVIEQVNHSNWLANIDPDEEIVEPIDQNNEFHRKLLNIALPLLDYLDKANMKSLTWGFDFIYGDDGRLGLLEINDMCGIPWDERCDNSFINSVLTAFQDNK